MWLSLGEGGSKTKIDYFDLPIGPNDNVVCFDVPVWYSHLMQISNSVCNSHSYVVLFFCFNRVSFVPDMLMQSLCSFYILKNQMDLSFVLETMNQFDDVGMVKFAQNADLLHHPLHSFGLDQFILVIYLYSILAWFLILGCSHSGAGSTP